MDMEIFYENLPIHSQFSELADSSLFTKLPDDWVLGLADVVDSFMDCLLGFSPTMVLSCVFVGSITTLAK